MTSSCVVLKKTWKSQNVCRAYKGWHEGAANIVGPESSCRVTDTRANTEFLPSALEDPHAYGRNIFAAAHAIHCLLIFRGRSFSRGSAEVGIQCMHSATVCQIVTLLQCCASFFASTSWTTGLLSLCSCPQRLWKTYLGMGMQEHTPDGLHALMQSPSPSFFCALTLRGAGTSIREKNRHTKNIRTNFNENVFMGCIQALQCRWARADLSFVQFCCHDELRSERDSLRATGLRTICLPQSRAQDTRQVFTVNIAAAK